MGADGCFDLAQAGSLKYEAALAAFEAAEAAELNGDAPKLEVAVVADPAEQTAPTLAETNGAAPAQVAGEGIGARLEVAIDEPLPTLAETSGAAPAQGAGEVVGARQEVATDDPLPTLAEASASAPAQGAAGGDGGGQEALTEEPPPTLPEVEAAKRALRERLAVAKGAIAFLGEGGESAEGPIKVRCARGTDLLVSCA